MKCQHINSQVKDSRPSSIRGMHMIRRRRVCDDCGHRFTTHELSLESILAIRRESVDDFIINKVLSAVQKSLKSVDRKLEESLLLENDKIAKLNSSGNSYNPKMEPIL